MLVNLLKYKDYCARIALGPSADAFHGRVLGMRDVIDFYGRTSEELRQELEQSVEDYLEWCAEEGTKPEKTWQGKLNIRVDEDLRHRSPHARGAGGGRLRRGVTISPGSSRSVPGAA